MQTSSPSSLAKEWHPTRNDGRVLNEFGKTSAFRAWWMCEKGHEWQTRIGHRSGGSKCPHCPKPVAKNKSLAHLYPEIAAEWSDKNSLGIEYISSGSPRKALWVCEKGHEWETSPYSRTRLKTMCPDCPRKAPGEYRLSLLRPDLAKEWHPTKNGDLEPEHFTTSSSHRAWWQCDKGHEWQIGIASRAKSESTCPFCPSLANEEKRLSLVNPDIIDEWHPAKNGDFGPEHFSFGSRHKAWWICKEGHEWKAEISRRSQGGGCPECSGHRAGDSNNLALLNPKLAREWHPTKNDTLSPADVTPGSNKRVWWMCERGHEWDAQISKRNKNRGGRGSGCPECTGRKAGADNNLLFLYPKVAREWHPTKNGDLEPKDFIPGSRKRIWWVCDKGHEWESRINTRYRKDKRRKKLPGCPECAGKRVGKENNLEATRPKLAKEWHPTKNNPLTAKDIVSGSGWKAWWKCSKGHEWEARVDSRKRGMGCPECSNRKVGKDNNLLIVNPALAKEWHPTKNGTLRPQDFLPGSEYQAWWQCTKGHKWQARIASRQCGYGCAECSGQRLGKDNSLLALNPKLAKEWHPTKNGSLHPSQILAGSTKRVWWRCEQGHDWEISVSSRHHKGSGCPVCNPGGYKDHLEGYLYLLYSKKHDCWQIGITNRVEQRLRAHKIHGEFEEVEILKFKNGKKARQTEQKILAYWRQSGFEPALSRKEMPQSGWSETVSYKDVQEISLKDWTKEGKLHQASVNV